MKNINWKKIISSISVCTLSATMMIVAGADHKNSSTPKQIQANVTDNTNAYVKLINITLQASPSIDQVKNSENRRKGGINIQPLSFSIKRDQVIEFTFDHQITDEDQVFIETESALGNRDFVKTQVVGSTFTMTGLEDALLFLANYSINKNPVTLVSVSSTSPIEDYLIFKHGDDSASFINQISQKPQGFMIQGKTVSLVIAKLFVENYWPDILTLGIRPLNEMITDIENKYEQEVQYLGMSSTNDGVAKYLPETVYAFLPWSTQDTVNSSGNTGWAENEYIAIFKTGTGGAPYNLLTTPMTANPAGSSHYTLLHELGHLISPRFPDNASMSESYAEWFSLESFRMTGTLIDNTGSMFTIDPYLANDSSVHYDNFDALGGAEYNHSQETMFWQLEDGFGKSLFPTVFQTLRAQHFSHDGVISELNGNAIINDETAWNNVLTKTIAQVANRDLSDFFTLWKIPLTPETITYMHSLPKMSVDLAHASKGEQFRNLEYALKPYLPTSMKVLENTQSVSPFETIDSTTFQDYFTGSDINNVDRVLTGAANYNNGSARVSVFLHKTPTNINETENAYYSELKVNTYNGVFINNQNGKFLSIYAKHNKLIFKPGSGQLDGLNKDQGQFKLTLSSSDGQPKMELVIDGGNSPQELINNTSIGNGWDFAVGDQLTITPLSKNGFGTYDLKLQPINHQSPYVFNLKTDSME